jgi:hypothetical protein
LAEPTTVATDVALAVETLVLAFLLGRSAPPLPWSRRLWVAAFVLTAVAATAGAARHALFEATASGTRRLLWSATYLALGLANLAFLGGLAYAVLLGRWARVVLAALAARCAVYSVLLVAMPSPRLVVADSVLSLVLILGLSLYSLRTVPRGPGPWLLAGLGISAAGALVQVLRLGPVGIFNHNDLFHVVQMGGLWLFHRAALRFPCSAR